MDKRMIVIGSREIFSVRAIIKKAEEAGAECLYVPLRIDDINEGLYRLPFVVLYVDEVKIRDEVIYFLTEKMKEKDLKLILAGESKYITSIKDSIPTELISGVFPNPVDTEHFTDTVNDYFTKVELGEFKKRILIVDDDPVYLRTVSAWLADDYKVSAVNSGLRAIKWLGKNKVDLILLDHEMPVTSGPHILEMLRSDEETKDIPVMFLTGRGDRDSVMKVLDLHPEAYLLKTISKDELLENLENYFKESLINEMRNETENL